MPAKIHSNNNLTITATVEPGMNAMCTAIRPVEANGWYSVGMTSGALTGVAAAGNVFSFRYFGTNLLLVRRVRIGAILTTAFTTGQALDYTMFLARNWTTSDSSGTAATLTGNNGKLRTSFGTMPSMDIRISAAAALTAGTRTLDALAFSQVVGGGGNGTTGVGINTQDLFNMDTTEYPLIFQQNEGFVIQNTTLMGAGGVVRLSVHVTFGESIQWNN